MLPYFLAENLAQILMKCLLVFSFVSGCVPLRRIRLRVRARRPERVVAASVALSGDGSILAAGAYGEASSSTGIGGDQTDDSAPYAGAVYLY